MSRQAMLLTAVGSVLVLALYWIFLMSPKRDELDEIRTATQAAIDEQARLTSQINTLRDVRARAPEVEAQLAATEALVPSNDAMPQTLRQLQLAADESGLALTSVAPGGASALTVGDFPAGASTISLSLGMSGSYFQVIDFLRRIEDPSITPRAIVWRTLSLGAAEYPTLSLTLSGEMFVLDRTALAVGGVE